MILKLLRQPSAASFTRGFLYVDDEPECHTLEDVIRDGPKVMHETAIPPGRYPVIIDRSQRFQRMLPHVLNVPGFTGIRIHAGNTQHDTSGCVLVGLITTPQGVGRSRDAMDRLQPQIAVALAKGEPVWLEIQNPV